ncbi:hypothetical protein BY458DRAFT_529332 [Sporodiniella umbellata]|nr:hypothetical protein BY458DRAFT_529332 [Sporodiniella umbellata]
MQCLTALKIYLEMNPLQPPQPLPEGWIALWDESSKRYYYVEQATGRSQWEFPSQPAYSPNPLNGSGEANSYHYNSSNNTTSPYPNPSQAYPSNSQYSAGPNSPYPSNSNHQQPLNPEDPNSSQERGLGNMFKGYGGVVAGGLIGLAAGKFLSNHHGNHHSNPTYYPPPPHGFGQQQQQQHHHHFF